MPEELKFPLKLTHRKKLDLPDLDFEAGFDECNSGWIAWFVDAVAFLESESADVRWVLGPREDLESTVYPVNDEFGYLHIGSEIYRVELGDGVISPTGIDGEDITYIAEGRLFTLDEDEVLFCRDAYTLKKVWGFDGEFGIHNAIRVADGVVVTQDLEGCHGLDADTGELIWQFRTLDWIERAYPKRWEERLNRPGGVAPEEKEEGPANLLGPIIDGKCIISYDCGLMVARDVRTGEAVWETSLWSYGLNDWMPMVSGMHHRNGRLYFNELQSAGSFGALHCVEVNTGEIVFQQKKPFTPNGCGGTILVDKYIIGGIGEHAAAFDVEAEEYVWEYEHKEGPIFRGGFLSVPGGFMVACDLTQELYWFQSADAAKEVQG